MFISGKGKSLPLGKLYGRDVCVWECELNAIFIFSFILLNILWFYTMNQHFFLIKNITWSKIILWWKQPGMPSSINTQGSPESPPRTDGEGQLFSSCAHYLLLAAFWLVSALALGWLTILMFTPERKFMSPETLFPYRYLPQNVSVVSELLALILTSWFLLLRQNVSIFWDLFIKGE